MNLTFRQAKNKGFVEQLTLRNMEPYYKELGIRWDHALFDANWKEFENYEIAIDKCAIGCLRLSHDSCAYYIRDLQINPDWHNKGVGTQAINFAIGVARKEGFQLLRLRVFCANPAAALYERKGFRICKTEDGTHYMERELS
ncbi:GNAT family N-acetyltransferase [Oceanospirillum linum]|uniref:GNAT family N-acetyltransferase n=1 Tax=Oceanospirillum linum TaxID=966 RepID=A0A1T1HDQ3_OCELI|nr:GNAT family N-acetyltransferase [Oceanospirillum linum]OOV87847.1 GNAT family N-acetyltransferase [Oceanospirillum linum]SEG10286.1 Acetyltransferase (GNAT) family protein [Oleiphilus messinensis]SMP08854.1 Acetyltransferase (GNAT) family protein [Oceanospirillum linum]